MPQTTTAATTGTWTEEEIRQQPASWIRSLNNIDNLRASIDSFLTPLLRKEDLRIVLTGAGTSAFIGDIVSPWLASYTGKNFTAVPTTDLVTNPVGLLQPCASAAADFVCPLRQQPGKRRGRRAGKPVRAGVLPPVDHL